MLKITFHEPMLVKDKDLFALFGLMEQPVRIKVEQVAVGAEGEAPKRRGRPAATPVPAGDGAAPAEAPKRRGRPPKAAIVEPAEGSGDSGEGPVGNPEGPVTDGAAPAEAPKRRGRPPKAASGDNASNAKPASGREALTKRFTALVEKDYDKALELLESFGVDGFSKVPSESLPEFDKALTEMGV